VSDDEYVILLGGTPAEAIHVEGKPLGRVREHDSRSRAFAAPEPDAGVTLVSVRHQRHIPVLDQGSLGSCTGNAMTGALGTSPLYEALVDANMHVALDESEAIDLYSEATRLDSYDGTYPPDDTGSSGIAVAKAAQEAGFITGYTHAFSLAAAQNALQTQPVIIGIDWYEGFDNPDADGLIEISGQVRGGHEVDVDEIDVERGGFWFTNSWGNNWGVDGRAFFTFETFAALMKDGGDVTVPTPLNAPAPTPTPSPAHDAPFLDAHPELAAHILRAAKRSHLTTEEWLVRHLDHYFRLL
jgi:hypothetical protein